MVNETHPTFGTKATGSDAYAEIVASPRTGGAGNEYENKEYTSVIYWCVTKDAIISLDDGDTDQIYVKAGADPVRLDGLKITEAIKAKNAVAGQSYANLVIQVQP